MIKILRSWAYVRLGWVWDIENKKGFALVLRLDFLDLGLSLGVEYIFALLGLYYCYIFKSNLLCCWEVLNKFVELGSGGV